MQETFEGPWANLGVDLAMRELTPAALQPGIGLRPGGERPDLEPFIVAAFEALYGSVAAYSRAGLCVVVDVGHHEGYSRPLQTLERGARMLGDLPVLLVGVLCELHEILRRRRAVEAGGEGRYLVPADGEAVPAPILRWQVEVHRHGLYDLEVDTTYREPDECAAAIRERLGGAAGTAMARLAQRLRG